MCEGHHGSGSASHCRCGEGHAQHDCDCGSEHPSECRCGGHHGWGGGSQCCCGGEGHSQGSCGGEHPFGFRRWFSTAEDEATKLEQYLKDLEAEAKGVRERLAELKGA